MKFLGLLALFIFFIPQTQDTVTQEEPVTVLTHKWFREKQVLPPSNEARSTPAAAMIPQNKNFERNRRANTSPGERDPNLDTIDGRSAAIDKAVQDSKDPKEVNGFSYRAKIHNGADKLIQIVFWEYQFKDSPMATQVTRRQFLCGVTVKPSKDKELQAFSTSGPIDVISVDALGKHGNASGDEKAIINRVEFADGSIWQRKDWKFAEIRQGYTRALSTPWGNEMCRGL
jgi:hypothetical protein